MTTAAPPIESELALPPEVTTLGRPLQVHREAPAYVAAALLFFAGLLFLGPAGLCLFMYCKTPADKMDLPVVKGVLYTGGALGLLGLATWLGAWSKSGLGRRGPRWAYLIYPEALVVVAKGSASTVRWDEITALLSPPSLGDFRVATRDGRTFPIRRAVRDYDGLISCVYQRVSDHVVTPLKRALDGGRTVAVGPFELSLAGIGYKGKALAWDQLAALEIQLGRAGRRLRIRAAGSYLPWCYADLNSFPNGVFFPDLLGHVCPARFLRG